MHLFYSTLFPMVKRNPDYKETYQRETNQNFNFFITISTLFEVISDIRIFMDIC